MALLLLRHRARVRGSPAGCGALWAGGGQMGLFVTGTFVIFCNSVNCVYPPCFF